MDLKLYSDEKFKKTLNSFLSFPGCVLGMIAAVFHVQASACV